jgi:hypothetical protein
MNKVIECSSGCALMRAALVLGRCRETREITYCVLEVETHIINIHFIPFIFSLLDLLNLTTSFPLSEIENLDLLWPITLFGSSYQVTPNSEPISLKGEVLEKTARIRAANDITTFNDAAPQPRSKKRRA